MRNSGNFAKGNMFSAREGSQPLGSRDFRARAAALNGDLAEIARFIYTRPAGDSLGGSFFFSLFDFVLFFLAFFHFLC